MPVGQLLPLTGFICLFLLSVILRKYVAESY
jgi:hypothetical protein